ncbi:zeta toxin family protein [Thiolapillus sp.]|uniref:zeta toxin family protein n=3 Tax=Thiolapillus sp. TaxID=2017437 RepID=UPI0025FF9197|nr:zeta toxin family protein [Thiolapillus sp.]
MIVRFLAAANDRPIFILLAGPNGSGKSTFREKRLLQLGLNCIDPDEVALDMFDRQAKTRDEARAATIEATEQIKIHFIRRESVCLETVFSDTKGHKKALVDNARASGYFTAMFFMGIDTPEVSIARVSQRVIDGGHDIPDHIISDRFPRAFENAKSMLSAVDLALLFDNTGCYASDSQPSRHVHIATIADGKLVSSGEARPAWLAKYGFDTALDL